MQNVRSTQGLLYHNCATTPSSKTCPMINYREGYMISLMLFFKETHRHFIITNVLFFFYHVKHDVRLKLGLSPHSFFTFFVKLSLAQRLMIVYAASVISHFHPCSFFRFVDLTRAISFYAYPSVKLKMFGKKSLDYQ